MRGEAMKRTWNFHLYLAAYLFTPPKTTENSPRFKHPLMSYSHTFSCFTHRNAFHGTVAHAYSHLNFNKLLRHRVCASIPLFTRTHHNHNKMKWNGKKIHGYNNKLSNESILCSKFVDCRHVESQCQKHLHHYCHCHKYHQHHSVRIAVRHFSFSVLLVLHTFFLSYSV